VLSRGGRRRGKQMARLQLQQIPSGSFKDKPTLIIHTNSNLADKEVVDV